ncbi:MAG TPA: sigma-70 family RNA polymerase sigma factor [Polyangiaceae bacterium]|nr:sigma-70 family RNA polymerase sigma factor [Polyangiaceae bacterium]
MPDAPDRDVLALLEQGDSRGFDLAYARYAERIFGFLLRLSGSRAIAEDLFQHTFMRLAEVGARLRGDSDLRAWLFSVARNAFHSHARSARSRSVEPSADVELFAASPGAGTHPDSRLALNELERALARMAENDRELLLLLAVEGLSHAELAQVLDLDRVTLRKRVSRARARLAEALDGDARVVSKSTVSE